MLTVKSISHLRDIIRDYHLNGKKIGFVPTMGALHEGHMSLMEIAKQNADVCVASIFVNPKQFAEGEDFDKYPRTIDEDIKKLDAKGVDVVYLPKGEEIYPKDFDIKISVGKIGQELEGVARPHFFDGVALVVTKLLMQVQPDIAVFGQKDYQQLHVIRKLVSQLDIPISIVGGPIVREGDGLAMSSRNMYFNEEQRKIAPNLFRVMNEIVKQVKRGGPLDDVLNWGRKELLENGFSKVDYLEVRDIKTLKKTYVVPARLLVAAYLGDIRLIDNIEIA